MSAILDLAEKYFISCAWRHSGRRGSSRRDLEVDALIGLGVRKGGMHTRS